MKDKRQKMTWPCGDPVLAAYILQAAAANGTFPFNGLYPHIGQFSPRFRPPMFPPGLGLPPSLPQLPVPTPPLHSPPSPTFLRKEFIQHFPRPLLSIIPSSSPPHRMHSMPRSPNMLTENPSFLMPKICQDSDTNIDPMVSSEIHRFVASIFLSFMQLKCS